MSLKLPKVIPTAWYPPSDDFEPHMFLDRNQLIERRSSATATKEVYRPARSPPYLKASSSSSDLRDDKDTTRESEKRIRITDLVTLSMRILDPLQITSRVSWLCSSSVW
jgi:hypothetical protein